MARSTHEVLRGPPRTATELSFGIEIGVAKISAAAVDSQGGIVAIRQAATPAGDGPIRILAVAADLVHAVADEVDRPIDRVGVGAVGHIDTDNGIVVTSTPALQDWAGTPIRAELSRLLSGVRVDVVNDMHAFALAEAVLGAGRDAGSVFAISVGGSVDGAFIKRPTRVVEGAHHLAGNVGHLVVPGAAGLPCPCGRTGHLEAIASGPGIVAGFVSRGGAARSGQDVAQAVAAGDPHVAEAIKTAGEGLGVALACVASLIDPDLIVVGGGAIGISRALLPIVRESFRDHVLPSLCEVPIRQTALERPVLAGAALLMPTAG